MCKISFVSFHVAQNKQKKTTYKNIYFGETMQFDAKKTLEKNSIDTQNYAFAILTKNMFVLSLDSVSRFVRTMLAN